MADQPLTCPYCNAQVPLPAGMQAGRRLECPTCGEAFALPASQAVSAGRTALSDAPAPAPERPAPLTLPDVTQDPGQVRRINRRTAALILAVMLGMACTGLVFALFTWHERRSHDTGLTQRPKRSPIPIENSLTELPPVAPDRLAALGYLPRGIDFLVAARVAELLQTQSGKRLLQEPLRVAGQGIKLSDFATLIGLELEQIDHLVLAHKLENSLPPWLNVVIRTREPYDAEALRKRLKAEKISHEGKKRLYRFQPPQFRLPLVVWFADEHTLVLGVDDSQVEAAPETPRDDLGGLPEELQTVLREHRPAVAPLWIAAHSRDWSRAVWARPLLERLARKSWQRLREVPTFGIWVELNSTLRTQVVLHARDERSAHQLEDYLGTVVPADPDRATLAREADWVLLQLKTDPALLQGIMEK